MVVKGFLIARADGSLRVVMRTPNLRLDEVAFPLAVAIPSTWGKVQAAKIDVTMPDPPQASVTVGEGQIAS